VYEGSREGHALALPAGIRPDRPLREGLQLESLRRSSVRPWRILPMETGRGLDIFTSRQVRVAKRIVPQPPQGASHVRAMSPHIAVIDPSRSGARQSAQEREKRRLSGAVRPSHDDHPPLHELT
jgi:hypothetical protein